MLILNVAAKQEITSKVLNLATEKKNLPILNTVLVEVENEEVFFTASNGTETVRHLVNEGITVKQTGSFLLPSLALVAMEKVNYDIEITVEEKNIVLSEASSISKKKSTSMNFSKYGEPDEFPKFSNYSQGKGIQFKGLDLKNLFLKTKVSVSDSETRPVLTGVNMIFSKDQTQFVSTDTHRLTQIKSKALLMEDEEITVNVSENSINTMLKSLDFNKDVTLYPSEHNLTVVNGNSHFTTRLLEGNYPDTSRLMPTTYAKKVVVNRQEILEKLKILKVLGAVQVKMDINSMFVSLSSSGETVRTSQEIAHESWESDSDDFSISFNLKYFMDLLQVMDKSSVAMEFTLPLRPFLLKYLEEEKVQTQEETYLLLPIRA